MKKELALAYACWDTITHRYGSGRGGAMIALLLAAARHPRSCDRGSRLLSGPLYPRLVVLAESPPAVQPGDASDASVNDGSEVEVVEVATEVGLRAAAARRCPTSCRRGAWTLSSGPLSGSACPLPPAPASTRVGRASACPASLKRPTVSAATQLPDPLSHRAWRVGVSRHGRGRKPVLLSGDFHATY